MKTILAIIVAIVAILLVQPIAERLEDRNAYQRRAEALDLATKQYQFDQQQAWDAATFAGRVSSDYGLRLFAGLALALLSMYGVDSYRRRQARIDVDRRLVWPQAGMLPVDRRALEERQVEDIIVKALEAFHVAQIEEARRPFVPASYAPHISVSHTAQPDMPPAALPGAIDILKPLDAWMAWIDEQPHTLLAGRTKAGKTWAATSLLEYRLRRSEQVYIIDAHSSDWLGLPTRGFVGLLDNGKPDTTDLQAALLAVLREYLARMQARDAHKTATGRELPHDHFGRLTVLLDEANYIADALPTVWREFVKVLASGGRKVGVSLICLAQSPLVEDLGISGSMRANFARVALDDRTIQQLLGSDEKNADRKKALQTALVGLDRPAAATIDAAVWLLDRRGMSPGTAPAGAMDLVWSGETSNVSQDADGRLNAGNGKETSNPFTTPEAETSKTSNFPTPAEIARIAILLETLPPSKIAEKLDGYHPRKYAEYKAKVDAVVELLASRA